MIRLILSVLLILGGIILGLYVGVWWGFIGGIVQVIEAIQHQPISAIDVACGIARFLFAGTIGMIAGIFPVSIGVGILSYGKS